MNAKRPAVAGLLFAQCIPVWTGTSRLGCLTVEIAAAAGTTAAIATTVAATAGTTAAAIAATKTTAATAIAVAAAEAAATRCALDHHVHTGAHGIRLSARWGA